jgi:hypothetical protein
MPVTPVVVFKEANGECPLMPWFLRLQAKDQDRIAAAVDRLHQMGHELRRPEADLLRDHIWELRVRVGRTQHRLLYFFHGRQAVVISHGITKEREVPAPEIDRAVARRERFLSDPRKHSVELVL